ncbi:MAG: hypothetical protein ABI860_00040 [Gemmatimonadales bacterium]
MLAKAYKAVPGVADLSGFGGQTMQYQVVLDPTWLIVGGLFSRLLISVFLMPVLYAYVAREGDRLEV